MVDGDQSVSYTHRNLPLDAEEAQPSRNFFSKTHALSNGNTTCTTIKPIMSNGFLSSNGSLSRKDVSSNGIVTSPNNKA
jgi:hypothetical protein